MVWQKGQSGNEAGKKAGTKNKVTLLKEERRAVFDQEISKKWVETINQLKPEYVADQFMGKAPDELIVRAPVLLDEDIAEKNEITSPTKSNSEGQAQVQSIKVRKKIRENDIDKRGDQG